MPHQEVDEDVSYFYEDRGRGPAIVMLPGWGLNHLIYEGQVFALRDRYRVITVDWRGCGQSSRPADGNTLKQIATDVSRLISALELDDVTLVGWSLGGNIALECALADARVGRVVSICAGLPKWTDSGGFTAGQSHENVLRWISALQTQRGEFLAGFASGWFLEERAAESAWLAAQVMDASRFIDDTLRDLAEHDLRPSMGLVQVPVGLFHGRHDQNAPLALAQECHRLLPHSTLEVFENSAHVPFMEESEEFNRRLDAFITSTRGRP